MQFQVPQFIDIEDKVIGPLTLRQFLYLAAGFGISMIFYFTVNFIIWIIITLIVGSISISLAFVKINGQPLIKIIIAMINFYLKPQIYIWQPEKPNFSKTEENIKRSMGLELIDLFEKIVAGLSLKKAQEKVTFGISPNTPKVKRLFENTKERYEIFKKISGEKTVARRIDYH